MDEQGIWQDDVGDDLHHSRYNSGGIGFATTTRKLESPLTRVGIEDFSDIEEIARAAYRMGYDEQTNTDSVDVWSANISELEASEMSQGDDFERKSYQSENLEFPELLSGSSLMKEDTSERSSVKSSNLSYNEYGRPSPRQRYNASPAEALSQYLSSNTASKVLRQAVVSPYQPDPHQDSIPSVFLEPDPSLLTHPESRNRSFQSSHDISGEHADLIQEGLPDPNGAGNCPPDSTNQPAAWNGHVTANGSNGRESVGEKQEPREIDDGGQGYSTKWEDYGSVNEIFLLPDSAVESAGKGQLLSSTQYSGTCLERPPIGYKNRVSQGRWSLGTGSITLKCRSSICQNLVILQDRWSLMAVVSKDRSSCIIIDYCGKVFLNTISNSFFC